MLDLWYKNAVIYCLDVETFMDCNGDGIGDFAGWPTGSTISRRSASPASGCCRSIRRPNRDNGYDITDYYGVDPRLGTLGDFVDFTHAGRTSAACASSSTSSSTTPRSTIPGSRRRAATRTRRYRDWYVWSKEKPKDIHEGMVFPGVQDDDLDLRRGRARPGTSTASTSTSPISTSPIPAVREEIEKIMGFWLQLGVSGFRIDAVPFLIEYKGVPRRAAEGRSARVPRRVARLPRRGGAPRR